MVSGKLSYLPLDLELFIPDGLVDGLKVSRFIKAEAPLSWMAYEGYRLWLVVSWGCCHWDGCVACNVFVERMPKRHAP